MNVCMPVCRQNALSEFQWKFNGNTHCRQERETDASIDERSGVYKRTIGSEDFQSLAHANTSPQMYVMHTRTCTYTCTHRHTERQTDRHTHTIHTSG